MTTIAYNYEEGIIAYDSRRSVDDYIVDDNVQKHYKKDGVSFFLAGTPCDYDEFIYCYPSGETTGEEHDAHAYSVERGEVYRAGVSLKNKIWKHPTNYSGSIGSGGRHAITAMDMGATAKEAVKWAMKRDTGTGGRIRTFKI